MPSRSPRKTQQKSRTPFLPFLPFLSSLINSAKPKSSRKRAVVARRLTTQSLESRRLLAAGSDDLAGLIDEFDEASSVSEWVRLNEHEGWNADQLQVYDINQTQPGNLVMQPETVTWFQDRRGPMAFKEVTGDFVFTTHMTITDRDDLGDSDADDVPDDAQFSLGGAMIRTPTGITDPSSQWAPGGENYVFLSLGHGTNGQFSYEVKTTTNSDSQLQLTPAPSGTVTLQVARIGDAVLTLRQAPGEDWIVHQRYSRPDMPDTLQVGLVTYSDWAKASDFDPFTHNGTVLNDSLANNPTPAQPYNPDLVAGFDYARFARPEVPVALAGVNLVNDATDAQLLAFLGDTANQPAAAPNLLAVDVSITDVNGQSVESLTVGDEFFAEIYVDDLRLGGSGVFSAFADANYDSNLASVSGDVIFGDDFSSAQSGDVATAGEIDELGGLSDDIAGDGTPQLLARVPMIANAIGQLTITTNAADVLPAHEIGLYGFDNPVDLESVSFGSDSVTITAPINDNPIANDDSATMYHDDDPISINVLANDTTEVGENLSIATISNQVGGTFAINDGQISFTPASDFLGTASASYTIHDGNGGQGSADIQVEVQKRWHLTANPTDVNNDGATSPLDALRIINILIQHGQLDTATADTTLTGSIPFYADVNNDERVSVLDALMVINELHQQSLNQSSESEFFSAVSDDLEDDVLEFLATDQASLYQLN